MKEQKQKILMDRFVFLFGHPRQSHSRQCVCLALREAVAYCGEDQMRQIQKELGIEKDWDPLAEGSS